MQGEFKQTLSAMAELGSYATPAEYAKRIAKIERPQNMEWVT